MEKLIEGFQIVGPNDDKNYDSIKDIERIERVKEAIAEGDLDTALGGAIETFLQSLQAIDERLDTSLVWPVSNGLCNLFRNMQSRCLRSMRDVQAQWLNAREDRHELSDSNHVTEITDVEAQRLRSVYARDAAQLSVNEAAGQIAEVLFRHYTGSDWKPYHHPRNRSGSTMADMEFRQVVAKAQEVKKNGVTIAVCGDYKAESPAAVEHIYSALDKAKARLEQHGKPVAALVTGGAYGTERIAATWAKSRNVPVELELPKRDQDGKAWWFRRNERIWNQHNPGYLVAFYNERGNDHMIKLANEAGAKVWEVPGAIV